MKKKTKVDIIIWVVFSILLAFFVAINRSANGDFVAYNGDFQNYNIFRRLLAGQLQYKDFVNYLGVGAVIMNIPFIAIFNDFGSSVFITNFITSIVYSVTIYILLYVLTRRQNIAFHGSLIWTAISHYLIITKKLLEMPILYNVFYNAMYLGELGHSMRTTRAFLPFLQVVIFYLYFKMRKKDEFKITPSMLCFSGMIMGMLIPWSNDFGYACVGCGLVLLVMLELLYYKRNFRIRVRDYVFFVLFVVIGLLSSVLIITLGDLKSYFDVTKGIMSYQYWYYGNNPSKYFSLKDIFDMKYSVITVIFFMYAIIFAVKLAKGKLDNFELIRLFLLSTNYAASLVYVIGSGAHNTASIELVMLFCVCVSVVDFLKYLYKKYLLNKINLSQMKDMYKLSKKIGVCISLLSVFLIQGLIVINYFDSKNSGVNEGKQYVEKLNINTIIAKDIEEIVDKLNGKEVFSTYASALEVMLDQYQPSGVDYIIHVLGDEAREQYMQVFSEGNYEYVTTLRNDYVTWEYWASRANWFFYKELYSNYSPYMQSKYSVIWKKTTESNVMESELDVKVERIDEATIVIKINAPEGTPNGYVDLNISYNTKWKSNRISEMAIRKAVMVFDNGQKYNSYGANTCYYLQESVEDTSIPVLMYDGYGEVMISSAPNTCTKLCDVVVSANCLIKLPEYQMAVADYVDVERKVVSSVDQLGKRATFVNTEYNNIMLSNACAISANGKTIEIKDIIDSGDYICVDLMEAIELEDFAFPNEVTVVKGTKLVHMCDYNWECGVRRNEPILLINSNLDTNGLKYIQTNDVRKEVVEIIDTGNGYKYLVLENSDDIHEFAYPANIKFFFEE